MSALGISLLVALGFLIFAAGVAVGAVIVGISTIRIDERAPDAPGATPTR